jgi:hypothetical protein
MKTQLRNEIDAVWTKLELPVGSFIRVGGIEYAYEANVTKSIDVDAVLKLYDDEEITRAQLLQIISADTKATGTVLGGDIAADLTVTNIGNKIDIRTRDLPVEEADEEYIGIKRQVRKKINRSKFGRDAANREQAKVEGKQVPVKRRIKTRKS